MKNYQIKYCYSGKHWKIKNHFIWNIVRRWRGELLNFKNFRLGPLDLNNTWALHMVVIFWYFYALGFSEQQTNWIIRRAPELISFQSCSITVDCHYFGNTSVPFFLIPWDEIERTVCARSPNPDNLQQLRNVSQPRVLNVFTKNMLKISNVSQ